MPETRTATTETKLHDLQTTVQLHTDQLSSISGQFSTIQSTMEAMNKKLHELSVQVARQDKQPLLQSPPISQPTSQLTSYNPEPQRTHQRLPKLDIPFFSGENVAGWLFQIERFFQFHTTPADQKLFIATFYMSGVALSWYQWMDSTKQLSTWEDFRHNMELRFGSSGYVNHEAELYNLKQSSDLDKYILDFENLSTRTPGLSNCNLLNCFIAGLRADIRKELYIHRPNALAEAIGLAQLINEKLDPPRSFRPTQFTPKPTPHPSSQPRTASHPNPPPRTPATNNRLPFKHLTAAEMASRKERGLCFNCDERYLPGHQCKPIFQCLLIEDYNQEPPPEHTDPAEPLAPTSVISPIFPETEPFQPPTISLHALEGHFVPSTLRLQATIAGRSATVLVDGGSTHNFMQTRLAKSIGLTTHPSQHLNVTVGNGDSLNCEGLCKNVTISLDRRPFTVDFHLIQLHGADLVLGVQWLAEIGPVIFDYRSLWMSFAYAGESITLHGLRQATLAQMTLGQLQRTIATDGSASLFLLNGSWAPPTQSTNLASLDLPTIQTSPPIPTHHHQTILQLLQEYSAVFQAPQNLPPHRSTDHHINLLPGSSPINVRPYRYPHHQKSVIDTLIKEMLQEGLIRPSSSPFSSPVLLVKKRDGSWRFCVDYRALNAVTIRDRFPIPTVEELLDELHGAVIFSKFDLRSGYHQIRVNDADIHKTAFRTHEGHYEFVVMPFGLSNAPATFQAEMNSMFAPFLRKFVLVFFDDILVYSSTWSSHISHLHQVLSVLQSNSFFAKPSKCEIGRSTLTYLGHVISSAGVAVDNSKISAIQTWPLPKSAKHLRGFLGLAGYYRKFVRNFAQIAAPLTTLLRKDGFTWSELATDAFEALKTALTTTPVLALPDFSQEFELQTDASGLGIGAVLSQSKHPIAFYSKLLSAKLQASSTYNRELYAVVAAVMKWRPYLLGSHFVIITDHQPLRTLLHQTVHTTEQQHWMAKLMGFDFEVRYRPGKENGPADALSRREDPSFQALQVVSKPVLGILQALRNFFNLNSSAKALLESIQNSPANHPHFTARDGLVLYKNRLWVPEETALRDLILHEYHATPVGGHAGNQRTLSRLLPNFYWPNMRQDVRSFISKCIICQQAKCLNSATPGLLQPLPIPHSTWTDISMDFITNLPSSGNKTVIMVVVDRLSKYAHFSAMAAGFSASSVAAVFVRDNVRLHGFPQSIVSDRDPVFMSKFWQELFRLQQTTLSTSSSYHPQSDGQSEVVNRCLEDYLRCFVADAPAKWLEFLPWAEWSYNTAHHSAINMSPYEAVYGHPPPRITDHIEGSSDIEAVDTLLTTRSKVMESLKQSLQRAQLRMKHQADAHRADVSFCEGDWVFVKLQPYRQGSVAQRQSNKLGKRYFGPFLILRRIGPVAYELQLPSYSRIHNVFHVSLLKRCSGDPHSAPIALPKDSWASHPLVTPQHIIGYREILRQRQTIPQFLIQWTHMEPSDATWMDATEFMTDYPTFDLEGKVIFDAAGNVTGIPNQAGPPAIRRSARQGNMPAKFNDYAVG